MHRTPVAPHQTRRASPPWDVSSRHPESSALLSELVVRGHELTLNSPKTSVMRSLQLWGQNYDIVCAMELYARIKNDVA